MLGVHVRVTDTNQGKFPNGTVTTALIQKQRSLVRTKTCPPTPTPPQFFLTLTGKKRRNSIENFLLEYTFRVLLQLLLMLCECRERNKGLYTETARDKQAILLSKFTLTFRHSKLQ